MTSSEHAEYADGTTEQGKEMGLVDWLVQDRQAFASVADYIESLRAQYEHPEADRGSVLQLRRMAQFVTSPNPGSICAPGLTEAFYQGEILGYHAAGYLEGEQWPEHSYALFNQNMLQALRQGGAEEKDDTTEQETVADLPRDEYRQLLADSIMGQLEIGDEELMPRLLDDLVQGWTQSAYGETNQQLYTLMGFRHIISQMMLHNAQMLARSRKPLHTKVVQRQFLNMMDSNGLWDDYPEVEPVNDIYEGVMKQLRRRIALVGDVDMNDDARVRQATKQYRRTVDTYMGRQDVLVDGTDVIVQGVPLYLVFNEGPQMAIEPLLPTEKLEGEFVAIKIMEVPAPEVIDVLRADALDVTEDTDVTDMSQLRLGAVLVLKQAAVVYSQDSSVISTPHDHYVGIVLGDPDIRISRYV